MNRDRAWQADLQRYGLRPLRVEQSSWAIWEYGCGRRNDRRPPRLRRSPLDDFYWLAFRFTETLTGVSILKSVVVWPGLRIFHPGSIFIQSEAVIGANCPPSQGVTIGHQVAGGPVPLTEDDVDPGAPAQVPGEARGSGR